MGALAASMDFVGQHRCFLDEGKTKFEVSEEMDSRTQLRDDTTGRQAATCFMNHDAIARATRLDRYRGDGTARRWECLQAQPASSDLGVTRNHTVGNVRQTRATVGEESGTNDGKHEYVLLATVWAINPSGL